MYSLDNYLTHLSYLKNIRDCSRKNFLDKLFNTRWIADFFYNTITYVFLIYTVPKPPKIDPKNIPEEIIVKKGQLIAIDIPFIGVPLPEGHWKKDGNPLSEADTDVRITDDTASIRIPDAQRSDTGQYELTLTNEVGSEVIPIPVRVLGKIYLYLYV